MKYLHILGLFAFMFVAACTSATTDTSDETVLEDDTTHGVDDTHDDETDEGGEASTTLGTPAPGVYPETVKEMIVSQPGVKEFTMIAKQWEFDPEVIRVNKGDTVRLFIESIDVTHGFTISAFGVNERLTKGKTIEVEFVADKAGIFTFFCSVQCGAGHSSMNGQLIVEE